MRHTVQRAVASLLAVLVVGQSALSACTEARDHPIFVLSKAPDDLEAYASGNLGVLEPRFARSYLYVAYRHLMGRGFDEKERAALVRFWRARLGSTWIRAPQSPVQQWQLAVDRIAPVALTVSEGDRSRPDGSGYAYYLNCGDDSFRNAAAILEEKSARYGGGSPIVRSWLEAQHQVFRNCAGGRVIPAPAGPDLPDAEQADRDYQIAAALFYSGNFEEAERLFRRIAQDRSSRWRTMAPFLAARCLVRRGTLSSNSEKRWDWGPLYRAQKELADILADADLAPSHRAARSLLNFVRFKTEPEELLAELSKRILEKDISATLVQDLWDYTLLLDRLINCGYSPEYCKEIRFVYDRSRDDLTDWIATLQDPNGSATEHALARWRGGGGAPWLVAVIMKTGSGDHWLDEVLAAAAGLPGNAPGFTTVAYHRARLLLQSGGGEMARRLVASFRSSSGGDWSRSTKNAFSSIEVSAARSFSEFLQAAARVPAATTERPPLRKRELGYFSLFVASGAVQGSRFEDWPALFTPAAQEVLDSRAPVRKLLVAAESNHLPSHLRLSLALSGWSRAVLLENFSVADRFANLVVSIDGRWNGVFSGFRTAKNDSDRRFEAMLVFLDHPEISPDVGTGELEGESSASWGTREGGRLMRFPLLTEAAARRDFSVPFPQIFSDAEALRVERERSVLARVGSAPAYFCRQAVLRAKTHPTDPRVPETLYRAIQTTRHFAVSDWSRRAFVTLHRLYPDSPAAKRAKYWY